MSIYEVACHLAGCILILLPLWLGYIVAELVSRHRRGKDKS